MCLMPGSLVARSFTRTIAVLCDPVTLAQAPTGNEAPHPAQSTPGRLVVSRALSGIQQVASGAWASYRRRKCALHPVPCMSILSFLTHVLFVGQSLVDPNLPALVEGALRASGATDVSVQIQGDYGTAPAVDMLVLTDASVAGGKERIFTTAKAARVANPAVQIYLAEAWPSLKSGPGTVIAGDPGAGVAWRNRITQDAGVWQGLADQASQQIGGDAVEVIPTGQAFGLLADAIADGKVPGIDSIQDMFTDDMHPNGKGLYFVALLYAAAMTGENPKGLPAQLTRHWQNRGSVIPDTLAPVLQRIAWAAVQARVPVAAPLPVPVPPVLTGVTNPKLSVGLAGVNDWSVQQPFLNVMKTARVWTGHKPGQWGGVEYDALVARGVLDADGWPKSIPADVTGLSTLILTDLPPDAAFVAGRYVLTYAGKGTLKVEGRAQNVVSAPGRVLFDYAPGEGGVILTLVSTDAADPMRDIIVVRQDRADMLASGRVFNPDWLVRLRGVAGVRFMDWMATNNATLATVADRPKPNDFTWARNGVPVEVMVALANELQADPWFTLPHLSDDALVRFYADYTRDHLDGDLQASVEFSNEVWNWQFAQAKWAEEQGKLRWGQDQTWVQYYGLRAAEVMDIWTASFGAAADQRLVRVVATQTGWQGLEEQILDAPLVVAEGGRAPVESFDAYAVTGYFSALLGSDEKLAMVKGWLAEGEDKAVAQAVAELRDGSVSGDATDSLVQVLGQVLPYQAGVARARGLRLVMYEGGTHVVGYGAQVDDAALTAFFNQLNYAPEMGVLYADLLTGWAGLTDAPFNAFVDVYRPGKWGSWGALRHLGDDNPRWQALAKGCAGC